MAFMVSLSRITTSLFSFSITTNDNLNDTFSGEGGVTAHSAQVFCNQQSVLAEFEGPYAMLGIKPGLAAGKNFQPTVL